MEIQMDRIDAVGMGKEKNEMTKGQMDDIP